jgi:hypothetical protein
MKVEPLSSQARAASGGAGQRDRVPEPSVIGRSVKRVDLTAKVTGDARYVADMSHAGLPHPALDRRPCPHPPHRREPGARAARREGGADARERAARAACRLAASALGLGHL